MSDYEYSEDEQEIQALEALEADAADSFELGLFEEGDKESGFHTKNDPDAPFQRSNVTQRKGAVDVKCSVIDIVHGQWGADEADARASLIVLLFRFDSRKKARRIAEANIEFKFFDNEGRHRKNPEVYEISLNDSFSLVPTKRSESITRGAEGTAGGGILGAELSGTLKWEKKIDQETSDATHVIGSIDRLDAPFGPSNAASWTLKENETMKTGVPAAMRVGILLKRTTDDDFKCTVKIETKVDFKTKIEQLMGGREDDDPIFFRTSLPPTKKLQTYDAANLGSFDVTSVEDVVFTTMRNGAIKGQAD